MSMRFVAAAAAALLSATAAGASLEYQPIPGASPEPIREGAGLKSPQDLEAFIDGVLGAQLSEHHIAGAQFAVVKDGEVFFAKGYGYADVAKRTSVDPDKTLFRPGSTSKLFTWTALMQLVEQGKVKLDDDVNNYVTQFKIPATFSAPITVRNLFTHTPGLEDNALGLMARDTQSLVPMAKMLGQHIPKRVVPPTTDFGDGRIASYSNWGCSLAGLIVETVSGMPFEDYVDKNIFAPLGMTSSTFRQPLPAALAPFMSHGYSHELGVFKPHEFELINGMAPAGSMSSTAADMAKFMIANLNGGAIGDQRILKEETARLMHGRAFSPNPHVSGSGLGFYEEYVNGYRLVGHGGDTIYFHTLLMLVPEANVGLYVSYNTAGSLPIDNRGDLIHQFMDRYFPAKLPDVKPAPDFAQRAAKFAGSYRSNRHSRTSVEKFLSMFGDAKVVPTKDGTLLMTNVAGPGGSQWVEVKPGVFREIDDDNTLAFVEDEHGEVTHVVGPFAFIAAYKLAWYETAGFHYLVMGLALLGFVVAVVSALRNWRSDRADTVRARRARRLAGLTGLLFILFVIGIVASIASLSDLNEIVFGMPSLFKAALALPLVCIPLTLALLYFTVVAWRQGFWTRYARVQYAAIALLSLAFLWSLNFWNLLGYRFG